MDPVGTEGDAMDDMRKYYLSYGDKFKDKVSLFVSVWI